MKKKLFAFLMCAALVLSIGTAAYAASDYTMTYKPGTTDAVTGMPQNDSGTGGEPYAVSSAVPQREGYEFIDWTLDYGVSTETSYTVRYLKEGTEEEVAPNKFVTEQKIGAAVTETAVNTEGFQYNLIGEESQTKTLGQNAEENVITFYYAERPPLPAPEPTIKDYITDEPYIVHHIHQTGWEIITDYGTAFAGEPLTVYARDDLGYAPIKPFERTCESVPCNHVLEVQEFKMIDEGWYRIISGKESDWQIDGLMRQNCVVAKKDGQYIIWTLDERNKEEKTELYDSFRSNVYGMSDAAFEDCLFMYGNGSTLNGFTVMDDHIYFDEPDGWSLAVGFYFNAREKVYEKGGDILEFYFLYRSNIG